MSAMLIRPLARRVRLFVSALALGGAACVGAAQAATLLIVDVTDPSAVTITATGAAAEATASTDGIFGFSLLDFFPTAITSNYDTIIGANTLTAGSSAAPVQNDFFTSGQTLMNLYQSSSLTVDFTTSGPAFTGTMTMNLSLLGIALPSTGAFGRIAMGDNSPFGTEIGSWEVAGITPVPLPAGLPLLLAGGLALAMVSRRRRA